MVLGERRMSQGFGRCRKVGGYLEDPARERRGKGGMSGVGAGCGKESFQRWASAVSRAGVGSEDT